MNKDKLSIKDWNNQDQPREKLLSKGIRAPSDAELLAILIGSGSRNESAVELSKRILQYVENNLSHLGNLTIAELISNFKGIGEAKAVTIVAALELGRRRSDTQAERKQKITCSADIYKLMQPIFEDLPHEEFWCILLSRANKVIKKVMISKGGISGTVVDNRIILKHAIENLASGIIVCHNHPSGNKEPSKEDLAITQKLKEACEAVDIKLLDHLIICNRSYYSFSDENVMNL